MSMFPLWKYGPLWLYYTATLPQRMQQAARWAQQGNAPVVVLFHHRIADTSPNAWTASRRVFACQIDWLSRHFDLVSLGEAQRRIASGVNGRVAVSITFDDGYAENCDFALPLLLERGVPCTYFVSSLYVLDGRPFPHDVSLGNPLPPNTRRQIHELAQLGVEIGAHTRRHVDLGAVHEPDELRDELLGSKQDLEDLTGRAVRYFAFPFGHHVNLNPMAFALARQMRFDAVCSAYGGFNFPGDDPFHIQRVHADNDLLRLKNWVTGDRRKLRAVQRYAYVLPELCEPSEVAR